MLVFHVEVERKVGCILFGTLLIRAFEAFVQLSLVPALRLATLLAFLNGSDVYVSILLWMILSRLSFSATYR